MPKILIGGLTQAHDMLIMGLFESMGHEVIALPEPDDEALKLGKIYCNKGQCNPVYYTAGNIIRYLFHLKERGEKDIEGNYIYVTAGSGGPCRFGMYEMEYRKAVADAGFPNFRIIALQQNQAMMNELKEIGFTLRRTAFIKLLQSFVMADLVNNLYYKTKPYEVENESADRWRTQALSLLYVTLKEGKSKLRALRMVKKNLDGIKLDYLQPKPKVKITGEFFSQIQEGDASYRLPGWLIEEGAEPVVEPVTTWLDYRLRSFMVAAVKRAFRSRIRAARLLYIIFNLKLNLHFIYSFYRFLLGNKPDQITSQRKLAKYAENYYHTELVGGEGHLEVGKHIYTMKHLKAHMVISIKPFGCMSSTQSDGVQTKVAHDLKNSLFVSVDTSGDAEVNFKSRVLMKLHEAKARANAEFERAVASFGIGSQDLQRIKDNQHRISRATLALPHKGVTTAVNALHVLH
jgi:predicted nucleotide-binding protein (sugar kinase/HSP70/actin superfamily)